LNIAETLQAMPLHGGAARGNLCSYGIGQRRQFEGIGILASRDESLICDMDSELRAFAIEHSQLALGCHLEGEEIQVNVRRCIDQSDYYLSPHADCPKTICAFLIYLWNGLRGTSLYRLSGYYDCPPDPEPGLRKRVNNFSGLMEYQRNNLDTITMIKPGCFAYFEHIQTIHPSFGSFLLIPNTRFSGAIPYLPQSFHGVSSRLSDDQVNERRDLILIDVKLARQPQLGVRSALQAQFHQLFTAKK
jgi:hypothetical protein